jgi:GT2 family glycosyltransferase
MGNIFDQYYQNLIVFTNAIMFRRKILDTVGMQDEKYWLFEEFEFVLRISKYYEVAFIDVPTYKMRYHDDQISGTRNKENREQVLIQKQTNLLEIAEKHGLHVKDYYLKHKDAVDKKLARLHRVLAVALMGSDENSKTARWHLEKSAFYMKREYILWFLTFMPHIIRRIAFKIILY